MSPAGCNCQWQYRASSNVGPGIDKLLHDQGVPVVGSNPRNQFWYNATALQLSIGPLAPGVGGRGRTCFDVNHAQGPDIDTYHCHPLYRGGGGERDYHNQ